MKHLRKHLFNETCADVYRHLCENLDAQFASEECKRIREHIEQCSNCHALLDSLKKTIYLYKHESVPALPKKICKKLFAIVSVSGKKQNVRFR